MFKIIFIINSLIHYVIGFSNKVERININIQDVRLED